MKKFWFVMKIIFLIGATMVMLWFGTECLNLAWTEWSGLDTAIGTAATIISYIIAFKGCRLAVEEIAKEITK